MSDGPGRRGEVLVVSRSLAIPMAELTFTASRSGGPGGQHANKTSSRIQARFDIDASPSLGPRQRARLQARFGSVVSAAASDERSQAANREIAAARLAARIAGALATRPVRHPTSPTRGSQERRLADKKKRAAQKRERRPVAGED